MSPVTDNHSNLAENARSEYRRLASKPRLRLLKSLLKRAAHFSPQTMSQVLVGAGIPQSFQIVRIDTWFKPDLQTRVEGIILQTERESWLQTALKDFFCNTHRVLNDRLLALVKSPVQMQTQLSFTDALSVVKSEFPSDPYVDLYVAVTCWVCPEAIKKPCDESPGHAGSHHQSREDMSSKSPLIQSTTTNPIALNVACPQMDFTALDTELCNIEQELGSLRVFRTCDTAAVNSACMQANAHISELSMMLTSLAAEAGEPVGAWSSREEFISRWRSLSEIVVGQKMQERHTTTVNAIASLLASVVVQHRLPSKRAALTVLARRASEELKQRALPFMAVFGDKAQTAQQWLAWVWTLEEVQGDESRQQLHLISPAAAEFLSETRWSDLRWSSLPASETGEGNSPALPLVSDTSQPVRILSEPTAKFDTVVLATIAPIPASAVIPAVARSVDVTEVPTKPANENFEDGAKSLPLASTVMADCNVDTNPSVQKRDIVLSHETPLVKNVSTSGEATVSHPVEAPSALVSPKQEPAPFPAVLPEKQESDYPQVSLKTVLPSTNLANALCATSKRPSVSAIHELAWTLAKENRWGLGSCVLYAAEREGHKVLSPVVFELAALGPKTNYEVSPVSNLLAERLARFDGSVRLDFAELEPNIHNLLVAGALLRPALLAAQSGAGSLLTHLALPNFPLFAKLVKAAGTFSLQCGSLRAELMQVTVDEDRRLQRIGQTQTELRHWLQRAPNYSFNFAPAAKLWRFWLKLGGNLHRLIERGLVSVPGEIPELAQSLKPWQEHPVDCIQQGMKEIGQRTDLDGKARGKMTDHLREMTDLLSRLIALHIAQPGHRQNHQSVAVADLRHLFEREASAAEQELKQWTITHITSSCHAVAQLCRVTMLDARRLFDCQLPLPGSEPDPQMWLTSELLRDPALTQSANELPSLDSLIRLVGQGTPNWESAADKLMQSGDFESAEHLVNWMEEGNIMEQTEMLRQRWQQGLENTRTLLQIEAQAVAREIHHAVSHGLCREKDFGDWNAEVESVKITGQGTANFRPLRARLRRIQQILDSRRQEEAEPLRQRLRGLASVTNGQRDRVDGLLRQGDIHTAEDFLGRLEKGEPLEDISAEQGDFEAFFGEKGWLPAHESEVTVWPQTELASAISKRSLWAGLDFSRLLVEQILPAEQEARLWASLERGRSADQAQVLELARFFGLEPISAQAGTSTITGRTPWQRWTVTTQPVNRRSICPVPQFGSDAGGRYEFTLLWGSPAPEDIVQSCRSSGGDTGGSLVVTFSTLTTEARRTLERAARRERFRGLVVDRALFLFLMARPAKRFSTLLRCALPFSVVEPYVVDTSGRSLPPEMFFGRQRELDLLVAPRGSCFVYGGRQLGKTALLRMAEREFHSTDKGRIGLFIDLKAELLSQNRPMDDLWAVLAEKFKKAGVLEGTGTITSSRGLLDGIRRWLDATPGRRVLLLLDEADFFLETDGNAREGGAPFQRCDLFRGLMDQTERRFKVVFAGLHNVKRSTELANHPLAHFGEAICVGPLLTGADARAARELVEQPLATVGYFFETPDLANRVLALTNYYPSLIQIFGHHLLNDLQEHHTARFPNWRTVPPCRITAQHVETAFSNRVRTAIHEKYALTLQLDARYKLIAYLLAYYHLVEPATDGQDAPTLRRDAERFWPAGFSDLRTDHQFRVLLEEMVGLGVLRASSEGARFALRNRNVVLLLGTQEQIERELDQAKQWEPALKYEADKFRQVLSAAEYRFSPLTAQQEGELKAQENRVVVLFGHSAGGWADVPVVAHKLFDKAIERYSHYQTPEQFSIALEKIGGSRKETHSLALVPSETGWDARWLEVALQRVETFRAQDKFTTILFLADPRRAWEIVASLSRPEFAEVRRLSLDPWHDAAVRQWLHERDLGDRPAMRQRILKATGNWPLLIQRLAHAKTIEQVNQFCQETVTAVQSPVERAKAKATFGLDLPDLPSWLPMIVGLGPASEADILDILRSEHSSITLEELRHVLMWAEALSLARKQAENWQFDPIVVALLG